MFKNIICATDLSPSSAEALHLAVQFAATYNAKLTVLNVHEEFMDKSEMVMLRVSVEQMQEHFREIALEAKKRMAEAVTAVGVDDLEVDYLLQEGKPGEAIVAFAKKISTEQEGSGVLVVMGTNGKHSIKDFLIGSVAEYVINHSPCPVVVAPIPGK